MRIISWLVVLIGISVLSCNKPREIDFASQLQKDIETIDAYLAAKGINALKDSSGLRYIVDSVGHGIKPTINSTVSLKYTTRLLPSETPVDQSPTGVLVPLNTAIPGLQIGIPLMTKGSKFRLFMPSGLAFGLASVGTTVPPNSNLTFDITLLDDDALLLADIAKIDTFLIDSLHTSPDSIHKHSSGARYVFAHVGSGSKPISTSTVNVTYTGKFLPSQKVFEQQSTVTSLPLPNLLTGWQNVLPLIPNGSQFTLYLPSGLAYGPQGSPSGTVTPDAILIFDINLISSN